MIPISNVKFFSSTEEARKFIDLEYKTCESELFYADGYKKEDRVMAVIKKSGVSNVLCKDGLKQGSTSDITDTMERLAFYQQSDN